MLSLARLLQPSTVDPRREGFVMSKQVILSPSVTIGPIPTDTTGIVRGATITVTGTADCDMSPEPPLGTDPVDSISEVAVCFGRDGSFDTAKPTGPVSS